MEETEKNKYNEMKVVNSSSTLLHIMIPQIQQLLPLETNLSGTWSNPSYSSKFISPPVSVTPSSICTDLSDGEYQAVDLSLSRKCSLSTPPLSNIKSESLDSIDSPGKSMKKVTNFTIEHLLSTSFRSPPTFHYLTNSTKPIQSIFTKKKTSHFTDHYLHQILQRRKCSKIDSTRSLFSVSTSNLSRNFFVRCLFDLVKDLIHQDDQIKKTSSKQFFDIDALEQLAEIACKLDTRHVRSIFNENQLTSKSYEKLLKQLQHLIKRIDQKYQQKKARKRLYYRSKATRQRHFRHFPVSILNLLNQKRNFLLPLNEQSDCHRLTSSDKSRVQHLKPEQIKGNLEILLPNNDLVYEGTIEPIDNYDDLLLIRLNHERQTYLIPIHDLCRLSCPKIIPDDFHLLSKGSRVCALWSTSLRGLHPATVKKVPSILDETSMISLLFDDGDTGLIKLDEIRLLPENFPIKGVNLDEWRVSSFQIPTSRRGKSKILPNSNSNEKTQTKKNSSTNLIPQWTLNLCDSTISRSDTKEIVRKDDCVVLHGADKSLSYIGKVLKFYRNRSTQQDLVRLKWFYSPQETPIGPQENDLPGALYDSTHIDENPISTIRFKGTIYQSYDEFVEKTDCGKKRSDTEFYLVGHYDPVSGQLKRRRQEKNSKKRSRE